MPRGNYTNPAPQTESARQQLSNFYCDLCGKGYARQNEFASHEGSYEHNHNKRRKELKAMSVSMNSAHTKKKKGADDEGIMEISGESGRGAVRGFKKVSGFKRVGGTVDAGTEEERAPVVEVKKVEREESDAEEPAYEYYDPAKGAPCGDGCRGLCGTAHVGLD